MNVNPAAFRRLVREIKLLQTEPPEGIRISTDEENILDVTGIIQGPDGTPYEGGYFKIKFKFTEEFPAAPPKCHFLTKIFHPNVSKSGEICVNTLKKDWKREFGIQHILVTIKCLLIYPNAESALDEAAGKLLLEKYEDYCRHARLMTGVHAVPKVRPVEFDVPSVIPDSKPTPVTYATTTTTASGSTSTSTSSESTPVQLPPAPTPSPALLPEPAQQQSRSRHTTPVPVPVRHTTPAPGPLLSLNGAANPSALPIPPPTSPTKPISKSNGAAAAVQNVPPVQPNPPRGENVDPGNMMDTDHDVDMDLTSNANVKVGAGGNVNVGGTGKVGSGPLKRMATVGGSGGVAEKRKKGLKRL